MSIDALALIVAEDHLLWLALQRGNFGILLVIVTLAVVTLLLGPELLNTAAVDLEFVVAETALVLRRVLVVRDGGVEIEYVFIWRLQFSKQVRNVGVVDAGHLLVGAVLRLLSLSARGKLQLIDDVLPDSLGLHVDQ